MDGNNFDELTRKLASGISRRSVLRGLVGGAAALVGIKSSVTLAGKASKTTICHATSSASNPWVQITVNDNSLLPAHYGHGDFNVTGNPDVVCCRSQDCLQPDDPCLESVCVIDSTGTGKDGLGGKSHCSPPQPKDDGTVCDDTNACTSGTTCRAGVCTGGTATVCTALDACHVAGTCNPKTGVCDNPDAPLGTSCDDNNLCNGIQTCTEGVCGGGTPLTCTTTNPCLTASCDPAKGCITTPKDKGTSCGDGNACNGDEMCDGEGTCVPGTAVVCDECKSCNAQSGICENAHEGETCIGDGNLCFGSHTCQSGTCTGNAPVSCAALDQCHVAGTCDPATGLCDNPNANNGIACNDGNACTQTDTCQNGVCTGSNPVTCSASDQCHVAGTCDPASGTCSNPIAANGTACNDGNVCTTGDTCQAGACIGGPVVDLCCGVTCPAGQTCDGNNGNCKDDKLCSADLECGQNQCCCHNGGHPVGMGTCIGVEGCDNASGGETCLG